MTVDPVPVASGSMWRWDPARYATLARMAGKPSSATTNLGGGYATCEIIVPDLPVPSE